MQGEGIIIHASCVAWQGRAALIRGASGRGKSSLALELMAFGATLVADDRVVLQAGPGGITASAPDPLSGLIEARGIGLLNAEAARPASVVVVVDLDHEESTRLPEPREAELLGQSLPLLHTVKSPHFAAALLQYLKAGRREDL